MHSCANFKHTHTHTHVSEDLWGETLQAFLLKRRIRKYANSLYYSFVRVGRYKSKYLCVFFKVEV